jgi:hypothetical protein
VVEDAAEVQLCWAQVTGLEPQGNLHTHKGSAVIMTCTPGMPRPCGAAHAVLTVIHTTLAQPLQLHGAQLAFEAKCLAKHSRPCMDAPDVLMVQLTSC